MELILKYYPHSDVPSQEDDPLLPVGGQESYDAEPSLVCRAASRDGGALEKFFKQLERTLPGYQREARECWLADYPGFVYDEESGSILFPGSLLPGLPESDAMTSLIDPEPGRLSCELGGRTIQEKVFLTAEDSVGLMLSVFRRLLISDQVRFDALSLSFSTGGADYTVTDFRGLRNGFMLGWEMAVLCGGDAAELLLLNAAPYENDTNRKFGLTDSRGILPRDPRYKYAGYRVETDQHGVTRVVNTFLCREGEAFQYADWQCGEGLVPMSPSLSGTPEGVSVYGVPFPRVDGGYAREELVLIPEGQFVARGLTFSLPDMPLFKDDDFISPIYYYNSCVRAYAKTLFTARSYHLDLAVYGLGGEIDLERDPVSGDYTTTYGGGEITAELDVPTFDIHTGYLTELRCTPAFKVKSVTFCDGDRKTVISPRDNPQNPRINTYGYEYSFDALKNAAAPGSGALPQNLCLNPELGQTLYDFEVYRAIRDLALGMDRELCQCLMQGEFLRQKEQIAGLLYAEEGMVPSEGVVSTALKLQNEYERSQHRRIPNLALVGQAGTGKTTLAKNLARALYGRELLQTTATELKPAYLGQAKNKVIQKLAEAVEHRKILFIDEAYELMSDEYGREVVSLLLPVMTGDRRSLKVTDMKPKIDLYLGDPKSGDPEARRPHLIYAYGDENDESQMRRVELGDEPIAAAIWLSGYEEDIRAMISLNQGLYRRLEWLCVPTPTTSGLIAQFEGGLRKIGEQDQNTRRKVEVLTQYLEQHGSKAIRDFFSWGTQPHTSRYFASHAGVSRFIRNCIDGIDYSRDLGVEINRVITETKLDIKRQLSVARSGNRQGAGSLNIVTDIHTTFDDLVGAQNQIAYMRSVIDMLSDRDSYESKGISVPKGALMEGLPGTGKTFVARAMAGELQRKFLERCPDKRFGFVAVSGTEIGNKPVDYISYLFSTAEEYDACILFIDEVDSIAKSRNNNPYYSHYLELIKQMDGIEKSSNVFILAATNAPENLDPAFVRPGRIDMRLEFLLPTKEERTELAKRALRKRQAALVNLPHTKQSESFLQRAAELIAEKTSGDTAGAIESAVNTGFIMYLRFKLLNNPGEPDREVFRSYPFIREDADGRLTINTEKDRDLKKKVGDLTEICLFILEQIEQMNIGQPNGRRRESRFTTARNEGCSATAVHEVGHALVSLMLYPGQPFDVITTLPRGEALGYVSHGERAFRTKADIENQIRVCMGGRIAEELIYGRENISGGAIEDMRTATRYARSMVEMWGFSEEFGFMSLAEYEGKYLGGIHYTCSDATRQRSDRIIGETLKKLYAETYGMLGKQKERIIRLARDVFNRESMTGEQFMALYQNTLKTKSAGASKR